MAENSNIAWCDDTFNCWEGCQKISPACDNCYAETRNQRFSKGANWGPHADRRRTSDSNWKKPFKWNREAESWDRRRRVFCASLADVFDNHKSILPQWRNDLFYMIKETPNLDWLLLTKRPQNIKKFLPADWGDGYPNVWLGTTVENQEEADRRIPPLLDVPARVHFLSCEPLLGEVEFIEHLWGRKEPCGNCTEDSDCDCGYMPRSELSGEQSIDWIIAGGESSPNYRPVHLDWFRFLRDQCIEADTPFLFKQHEGKSRKEIDAKGRELDGVVWNEYPQPLANKEE